jgi:hypothetical protein
VIGATGGIATSVLVLDALVVLEALLEFVLGVLEAVVLLLEPHAASSNIAASPATATSMTRGIAS